MIKKSSLLLIFLPFLLGGFFSTHAFAANLAIEGNVSYSSGNGQVTLRADRVKNNSTSGQSGTIRLELWATSSRYSGGGISGYRTASYQFTSTLAAGSFFSNVNRTVNFTDPPDGTYFLTLLVTEWTGSQFVIRDYRNFSNQITVGLDLQAPVSYSSSGSSITLEANRISNTRWSTGTGTLKLTLWATSTRYSGGSINGYVMGEDTFSPLGAGRAYSNVASTVTFSQPPAGTYFVTMTLSEFSSGSYRIKDYFTFNNQVTIGGAGGGGSSGGSGGGNGFGGRGVTLPVFGNLDPFAAPNWFMDRALGPVYALENNPWIWSTDLNEWIYLVGGRARVSSLGFIQSNGQRGWVASTVFGWVHFNGALYDNWIWTERFGWLWRAFDPASSTFWVWTPATDWMGFASDGSFYLWSARDRIWISPFSG
jgi:hypothetical protein